MMPGVTAPRQGCFDPRPREGGDLSLELADLVHPVSIHAPVKEATGFRLIDRDLCIVSIHASHEGGDIVLIEPERSRRMFRSTPP